ncbi:hypothetical protein DL96DRAFT_520478 [Flagelloscypha sp. PMI_526]|nr:hypothetical protein DL96DRAFT_520478 [Flagelloscypha sp. PMI_526]
MTTPKPSFATMASSFLGRAQNPMGASTASTNQPMFFSFATDDSDTHIGRSHYPQEDEEDEPHLLGGSHPEDEDEDPYLRLDEVDDDIPLSRSTKGKGRALRESVPLMAESHASQRSEGGWLAHGMASPPSSSPSPRSSSDSDRVPPEGLIASSSRHPVPPPPKLSHSQHPHQQTPRSISVVESQLTESLLPRGQGTRGRDEFSLPDPALYPSRSRRKYNDSFWTSMFLFSISIVYVAAFLVLILVKKPHGDGEKPQGGWHTPYTTLVHTMPLLTVLTFGSALGAYLHVYLLSKFVGAVMWATEIITPVLLLVSALWAFIGSFMWEEDVEPTWGESVGLRLFSLIPLILSIYTARHLFSLSLLQDVATHSVSTSSRRRRGQRQGAVTTTRTFKPRITFSLPRRIEQTSRTLGLTTEVMIANPFLMLLSPALLLVTAIASIPFAIVGFRLLLIGYFHHHAPGDKTWDYHLKPYVPPLLVLTTLAWLWGVMTARGILRVSSSACVGAWVHADPAIREPPPFSTPSLLKSRQNTHAALFRSTQPSFGTICIAALLLSLARMATYTALILQRLPIWLRPVFGYLNNIMPGLMGANVTVMFGSAILSVISWVIIMIESRTAALSRYALMYTGLTGSAFWPSVKRARELTTQDPNRKHVLAPPPHLPLSLTPLLLPLPGALATYLFVAHTLRSPEDAFGSAVFAAAVTFLVSGWAVGVVGDVADTLYVCYCVDVGRGDGMKSREEVWDAFEHDASHPISGATSSRREVLFDEADDEILPTSTKNTTAATATSAPSNTQSPPPPLSTKSKRVAPPPFSPDPMSNYYDESSSSDVAPGRAFARSHHSHHLPQPPPRPQPLVDSAVIEEDIDPFLDEIRNSPEIEQHRPAAGSVVDSLPGSPRQGGGVNSGGGGEESGIFPGSGFF